MRLQVALLALLLVGAGCKHERQWDEAVAPDAVELDRAHQVIKQGAVGAGDFRTTASYVLVPARNTSARDLIVTLRGDLVVGRERFELLPESLRVPAGGERTFALVDRGQLARPGASAEVVVSGALAVSYPPSIHVTDGVVHEDQGRAVAAANVENTSKLEARVPVIAVFHDPAGLPMERPFTVIVLAAGGKRGVQLVGPPGSKTAQLYVGEAQF